MGGIHRIMPFRRSQAGGIRAGNRFALRRGCDKTVQIPESDQILFIVASHNGATPLFPADIIQLFKET
ncbi:MAG: hypothetical protein QOK24_1211 [Verrucomicrobiota bacterium]|jgi:hypothetical protein